MIRYIYMEYFIIDKMDFKMILLFVLKVKMFLGIFCFFWIVFVNLKVKIEEYSIIIGIVCLCKEEVFVLLIRNYILEYFKWNVFRYIFLDVLKIMLIFRCYVFCIESGQYMWDI